MIGMLRSFKMTHRSRPSSFESYLQSYTKVFNFISSQNDSYSSFVRSKNTEGGYTFAYGKNICYNTKRHQYVFLFEQNRFHLNPTGSNAFLYGWKWYNTRNTAQTINAYWVEEDSYITQPYTIHHIYHFVESINFLWTKLMFPGDYPVVESSVNRSLVDEAIVVTAVKHKNGLSVGSGLHSCNEKSVQ